MTRLLWIMIRSCFFLLNPEQAMQAYGKNKMKIKMSWYLVSEVFIRVLLLVGFCYLETLEAFQWSIPKEVLWKYQYPHHSTDTVNVTLLLVICNLIPLSFVIAYYIFSNDLTDLIQGTLGLSLSVLLNGVVIDVIKICIGRPRPDYFYRCFPDGQVTVSLECSGDHDDVIEGRKSFPSGHAGWMFAGFCFLSLYLAGKLQCFALGGKTQSWRLLSVLTPLLASTVVGISRIQDNKHHWEDVVVGAIMGIVSALLCYHHYYPSLFSEDCFLSYPINSPYSAEFTSSQSALSLNASALSISGSRNHMTSSSNTASRLQFPEVISTS